MSEEATQEFDEQRIREAADALFKGGTIADIKGLSDDELETIYALGYNLYTTGQLKDADTVFRYLVFIDHTNAKYWIALGAVQQLNREFANAVTSYGFASFLDIHNPKPQYHAAECLLALGDKEKAESALAALDLYAPPDSPYRAKAEALSKKIQAGD